MLCMNNATAIEQFNANRAATYANLIAEAKSALFAKNGGYLTGSQINAAKAIATKRFNQMERSVYGM